LTPTLPWESAPMSPSIEVVVPAFLPEPLPPESSRPWQQLK
jgi:hypothetical protein